MTATSYRCTVAGPNHAGAGSIVFDVPAGGKVLHAMVVSGHSPLVVGCRGGGCGACRVRVVSGTFDALRMSARYVTPDDLERGRVLACRIVPTSDLVLEPAPMPVPVPLAATG